MSSMVKSMDYSFKTKDTDVLVDLYSFKMMIPFSQKM